MEHINQLNEEGIDAAIDAALDATKEESLQALSELSEQLGGYEPKDQS